MPEIELTADVLDHLVIIGDWGSQCVKCGKPAHPQKGSHLVVPTDDPSRQGCGTDWKYSASSPSSNLAGARRIPALFPHLIYLGSIEGNRQQGFRVHQFELD